MKKVLILLTLLLVCVGCTRIDNVEDLNVFENDAVVTVESLQEKGLIKKVYNGVKVLGNGKLEKALTVKANKFSKTAEAAITSAGGKIEVI